MSAQTSRPFFNSQIHRNPLLYSQAGSHQNHPKLICDGKLFRDPPWCHDCHPFHRAGPGLQNAILPGRFLRLRGEVLEIAAHVAASLHLHRRLFGLNREPCCRGTPLGADESLLKIVLLGVCGTSSIFLRIMHLLHPFTIYPVVFQDSGDLGLQISWNISFGAFMSPLSKSGSPAHHLDSRWWSTLGNPSKFWDVKF